MPDVGMWKSPNHWAAKLRDPQQSNQVGHSVNINPATATNDPGILRLLYDEAKAEIDRRGPGGTREFNNYTPDESNRFQGNMRDILRRGGYDTIKYPNFAEGKGEPSYLLTDPRQVRSRNAAFDPAKFGKTKDIMAGLAAALGLGSGLGEEK